MTCQLSATFRKDLLKESDLKVALNPLADPPYGTPKCCQVGAHEARRPAKLVVPQLGTQGRDCQ